ncbi:MAG: 4Fe-4S binding protein [Firmicutes bacterium]|nr:4Fe-4S binding protein [Bacillota bacterium]
MLRPIIRIDEEKCDGCGLCIPGCAEGALQIVNGKAKLVAENLCDGLGACLGDCPKGALIIEEREAEAFDEEAVAEHLATQKEEQEPLGCGCPGTMARRIQPQKETTNVDDFTETPSELTQWPVQFALVNPKADYFKNADLLIAADCTSFAYADFHKNLLRGRALAVGCPKLDDGMSYVEKLTAIIRQNNLKSITVAYMEVPCCGGLVRIVQEAVKRAGVPVPVNLVRISLDGKIINRQQLTA